MALAGRYVDVKIASARLALQVELFGGRFRIEAEAADLPATLRADDCALFNRDHCTTICIDIQ